MKIANILKFSAYGLSTILFKRTKPILGTIIVTDKCNLECKHCSVNNINSIIYPYKQIRQEMELLYEQGIRILFFCGGETFMWEDEDRNIRDLVIEAKNIGFLIVNVVTNGTFKIDLPEADLILLSLDGDEEKHNIIRGNTYQNIMKNIEEATTDNICLYMAINQINKDTIESVCDVVEKQKNVRAVSFNFHTPYANTSELALTISDKEKCCKIIERKIQEGYAIFNLKSAFPYIINNNFPTPCKQCIVMECGEVSICGRCIHEEGLCEQCGYFFAAEYALVFKGNIKVIIDMLRTYLKYI